MKGGVVNVLGDRIVVRADGDLLLDVIGDHDTGVGKVSDSNCISGTRRSPSTIRRKYSYCH